MQQVREVSVSKCFGQNIHRIVIQPNALNGEFSISYELTHVVVFDMYMLDAKKPYVVFY